MGRFLGADYGAGMILLLMTRSRIRPINPPLCVVLDKVLNSTVLISSSAALCVMTLRGGLIVRQSEIETGVYQGVHTGWRKFG
jgi:hypothetical protein